MMRQMIQSRIKNNSPDLVVIEDVALQSSAKTVIQLAQLQGAIIGASNVTVDDGNLQINEASLKAATIALLENEKAATKDAAIQAILQKSIDELSSGVISITDYLKGLNTGLDDADSKLDKFQSGFSDITDFGQVELVDKEVFCQIIQCKLLRIYLACFIHLPHTPRRPPDVKSWTTFFTNKFEKSQKNKPYKVFSRF